MKAKTLMGMIACAGACAVSVNVLATDLEWFDGKVSDTTASAISTPSNATWNATLPNGVTLGAGVINLDNDSESALVITPTAAEPLSDDVVTVSATAVLTPSAVSDLVAIDNAKAGFAIGNDGTANAYYGFAAGLKVGEATGWVKLAGAALPATDDAPTSFKIVLDYRAGEKNVKFFVGTTQLYLDGTSSTTSFPIGSATALTDVAAYGSGSISALAASCEKAVAAATVTVDNVDVEKKFGSVAEALTEAKTGTTLKDINSDGTTTTEQLANNGLYLWECDALNIAPDATILLSPVTSDVDEDNVTLAVSGSNPDEGVAVTYNVYQENVVEPVKSGCAASAIKIPVGTGKFTIKPVVTAAQ